LQVIDVSDPTHCVQVGGYPVDWPEFAYGVAVAGNYAYVADGYAGLQVIDVSDPTHCVRVGGCYAGGTAYGVAVAGNYAYLADYDAGLRVIDVSNPTNCVPVGDYPNGLYGYANGLAVVGNMIYLADGESGLAVLASLQNVQFTLRVDATPGVPFTIEAATNLAAPVVWRELLTTNVAAMPFDFVDFDVKAADQTQKFYRLRQP
jgi:hypothetical protein